MKDIRCMLGLHDVYWSQDVDGTHYRCRRCSMHADKKNKFPKQTRMADAAKKFTKDIKDISKGKDL